MEPRFRVPTVVSGQKVYFFTKSWKAVCDNEDEMIKLSRPGYRNRNEPNLTTLGPIAAPVFFNYNVPEKCADKLANFALSAGQRSDLATVGPLTDALICLSFFMPDSSYRDRAKHLCGVFFGGKHDVYELLERDDDYRSIISILSNHCLADESLPQENLEQLQLKYFILDLATSRDDYGKWKALMRFAERGYYWDTLVLITLGERFHNVNVELRKRLINKIVHLGWCSNVYCS
ncbi:unnamed protein product [Caenorhabditis auriculariae]|uniref:Uncharacterized protein n=1 Tax=Caenorhabditis auriculariae TaxID=2777116 RepID=A0A8S1HFA0_9PELO|nr:unnamed protein product [Caenorhabditis auriculariae]